MEVEIEYETICVNCKEKGYSFGYTLKSIEYKGDLVLDIPQQYLNGPSLSFYYDNIPIFIRSLENSHALGTQAETPIFTMINAKRNNDSTISRFTYLYSIHHHPLVQNQPEAQSLPPAKILEYVDIYRYPDKPYLLMFYSFRNSTPIPLDDFRFYQFYDFDILGQSEYDTDRAKYNPELGFIYQYKPEKSSQHGLFAGIGSITSNMPSHFEANTPQKILITSERLELRDFCKLGQDDFSVGLEWDMSSFPPGHLEVFPIFMAFGHNEEDFTNNALMAQNHLQKILPNIINAVNGKFRQLIDPELEKMSFSMKEWCKD